MNNPLISVVVPVYNTEQYLYRCIDSILSQTYTDFELLLIDDGSKDASGVICDEYEKRDTRVRVFHKENGGVSSARNVGLDNTKGEWVTFVDSDDWISEDFLSNIECCTADLVLKPYNEIGFNSDVLKKVRNDTEVYLSNQHLISYLENELSSIYFSVPWAKFYKRNIIGDLRFDCHMKLGEDRCFNLEFVYNLHSIETRSSGCYFYCVQSDFCGKYKMTIQESRYHLIKLYKVYDRLGFKTNLNRSIFVCYVKLCEDELVCNPEIWLNDFDIRSIYNKNKKFFYYKERLKYFLFRNQFVFKNLKRVFDNLHPI